VAPYKRLFDTNPFTDLLSSLQGFLGIVPGLPIDELAYFAIRMTEYLTSCSARRDNEYDQISWWDFMRADQFGDVYQNFLTKSLTRNLVAAQAEIASTRTIGLQGTRILIANILFSMYDEASRLLNGPTTEAWIDPWLAHLRSKGLNWVANSNVDALTVSGGAITGARVSTNGQARTVTADLYILAVPVERARELLNAPIRAIDPSLRALDDLLAEWMTGIQFFLKKHVQISRGHASYADSPWAVTSISQGQFWNRDLSTYGDGTAKDILSVDVSNWDAPASSTARPPASAPGSRSSTRSGPR
jgi:uncharacterized protein with NAD-binding domain and iron-sulfur cluster